MYNRQLGITLYQAISDGNEERIYKQWHASSIAECPRSQYMKRLGVPTLSKPSGAKILRWRAGHVIEEAIREFVEKVYDDPDLTSNIRLSSEKLDLTGEYDNYSPKHKKLIEIKSVHDSAFKVDGEDTYLKDHIGYWPNGNKKWGAKKEPYTHHIMQNYGYVILGKENDQDLIVEVESIDFIYISLAGRIVAYTVNVNDNDRIMISVKKRLETLNNAWATQTPPECVCRINGLENIEHPLWGSVLQWCDYSDGEKCCEIKEKK